MLYACGSRAISNGMVTPTLFPWRPALVRGRTPTVVSGSVYEADLNLQCGASRLGRVTLCADVACLAWGGWMQDQRGGRPGQDGTVIAC